MLKKLEDLFSDIKESNEDGIIETGSKKSIYGKIECNFLIFKGRGYRILAVTPENLEIEVKNSELFGQWGDEFPLHLIRG